jgi:hypothetical protein
MAPSVSFHPEALFEYAEAANYYYLRDACATQLPPVAVSRASRSVPD